MRLIKNSAFTEQSVLSVPDPLIGVVATKAKLKARESESGASVVVAVVTCRSQKHHIVCSYPESPSSQLSLSKLMSGPGF